MLATKLLVQIVSQMLQGLTTSQGNHYLLLTKASLEGNLRATLSKVVFHNQALSQLRNGIQNPQLDMYLTFRVTLLLIRKEKKTKLKFCHKFKKKIKKREQERNKVIIKWWLTVHNSYHKKQATETLATNRQMSLC